LAGFLPDGTLDGDFGQGGTGLSIRSGGGAGNGIVVAPDNTLWVAGGSGTHATLWHFDEHGKSPSPTTVAGTGPATAIARQSDGKLLLAAGTGSSLKLIRFNADGTLDSGFGTNGVATAAAGGPALAL